MVAVGVGVLVSWLGLGIAYYSPYPIGFWITTFAFAVFVAARVAASVARSPRWRLA